MDDSRIRTAAELISALISPKTAEAAGTWANVTGSWKGLAGERAAAHSRITDLENHVLTVEADHPGWIQMLQFRQGQLLAEIRIRFPALDVRSLQFRLSRKGGAPGGAAGAAIVAGRGDAPPEAAAPEPGLPPSAPLRLRPETVDDEALRKALSELRDAFEGR